MKTFAVEYEYDAATSGGRDEHRPAHRAWLAKLVEDGSMLAAGPYGDGAAALLLFRAEDEPALLRLLEQDPFSSNELISGMRVRQWSPVTGILVDYA